MSQTKPKLPEKLENGKYPAYAFPGGYLLYYFCKDFVSDEGIRNQLMVVCPECANKAEELVGYEVNWEDTTLTCDECGNEIEAAYDYSPTDFPN